MLFSSFDQFDTVTEPGWWGLPPALILILLIMSLNTYWARQSGFTALLFLIHRNTNGLLNGTALSVIPGAGALIWLLAFILVSVNLSGTFPLSYLITTQFKFNFALSLITWSTLLFLGWLTSPNNSVARHLPTHSPIYLAWFLLPIEAISSIIRPLTLSFRLAANLTAGHVILSLIASLLVILSLSHLPLFMAGACLYMLFEVAISIVQAYVFILLTTIYAKENTSPNVVPSSSAPAWVTYWSRVVSSPNSGPNHTPSSESKPNGPNNSSTWVKIQQIGALLLKFIRNTYTFSNALLIWVIEIIYSLSDSAHNTGTTLYNIWHAHIDHTQKLTILRGLITTNTRRLLVKFCNQVLFKFLPPSGQKIAIIIVESIYWIIHYILNGLVPILACLIGSFNNISYTYHAPWPLHVNAYYLHKEIENTIHNGIRITHEYAYEVSDSFFNTLAKWGTNAVAVPFSTRLNTSRNQIFRFLNLNLNVLENNINAHLSPTGQNYNHVLFNGVNAFVWCTVSAPLALYVWFIDLLNITGRFFWFIRAKPPLTTTLAENTPHHIEQLTALRRWSYSYLNHRLNNLFFKAVNRVGAANIKNIEPLFNVTASTIWIITGVIIVSLICTISTINTINAGFWLACNPTILPSDKVNYACRESNKNTKVFLRYLAHRGVSLSGRASHILHQFIIKTGEFHQSKINPALGNINASVKPLLHNANASHILHQLIIKMGEFHQSKINPALGNINASVKPLLHNANSSRNN